MSYGHLKELSLLVLILHVLIVNGVTARDSDNKLNNLSPEEALASRRAPPRINTYDPNPAIQSKRSGSPINRNGYNPSGRVDSVPGLNINIPEPRYDNGPPIPRPRPAPKKPQTPPKPVQLPSAPRIPKPYIGKGYLDAGDQVGPPQQRGRPDKIDGLKNPDKLLPPSIEGTKIDRIGQRRSQPSFQAPPPPRNPYSNTPREFRSGRDYNNAQKPPSYVNEPIDSPFSNTKANIPFDNPPRNPTFNNARNNPPFKIPQRNPLYNNNAPKPRDLPDYTQRYDEPHRHAHPRHSNSSFDNPRNIDFAPFDRKSDPKPSSNSPNSIPALPDPFQFSPDILKGDRSFPFPSSNSFSSRPSRPRPGRNYGPSNLFREFPNPLDSYGSTTQAKTPTNNVPQQRVPVVQVAPSFRDNRAISADPRYHQDPRGGGLASRGLAPVYGTDAGAYGDRGGQCFQYSFPAEAYRLSDLAKSYPVQQIQKEIDANPYLSPLVGLEAKAVTNDPFTFNAPISSHFDFAGFGFKNDATTSDKYSHLKNVKAYPGNLQKGDFAGRYPASMQPLDSACPSKEYSLKSFFHQGGDCYVVNPDFQQITYYRCTRQDCNFCGVNRGLSACVEEFRWVNVVAYCSALQENKRIAPMKLLLPVGCSCQHFVC